MRKKYGVEAEEALKNVAGCGQRDKSLQVAQRVC